jgi:glutamate--cysteine ligase
LSEQLKHRLSQLKGSSSIGCLTEIGHGIEKESLRVDPQGHIAQTTHPAGLGSPLTHPSITTDFSEALIEFITPVFNSPDDSLKYLSNLHTFLFAQMDSEELLWTSSMPCVLEDDDQIPLAQYGKSNVGKLKTLYRSGLSHRYGRAMQTIAGIHFNFSLPDTFWELYKNILKSDMPLREFKTEHYFNLIRNFRRYSWLLLYLFGASPAVCKSFLRGNTDHTLDSYDKGTFFLPHATCLRMGDLGYTSNAQAGLYVSYNNLDEYASNLTAAINTPYAPYSKFAPENGKYKQLNDSILQIENEFYSTIRPKRTAPTGTRPVNVLKEDGVEYIEVRCLDLNPFLSVGIDEEQINFLNSFLLFCLLRNSPSSDNAEYREIDDNLKTVVNKGREPGLELMHQGNAIPLSDWAAEILEETSAIAELMDEIHQDDTHSTATPAQLAKVTDSSLTPSAKVLHRMEELKTPYFRFAMNQSLANSDYFRALNLDDATMVTLNEMSAKSNHDRQEIENTDTEDFENFLNRMNAT